MRATLLVAAAAAEAAAAAFPAANAALVAALGDPAAVGELLTMEVATLGDTAVVVFAEALCNLRPPFHLSEARETIQSVSMLKYDAYRFPLHSARNILARRT